MEEVQELAVRIADVSALSLVESCSVGEQIDGAEWRNLSDLEEDYIADLEDEVRYLELRGLLQRHEGRPELVRIWPAKDGDLKGIADA